MLRILTRRSLQVLAQHQWRNVTSSGPQTKATVSWTVRYMVALVGAGGGVITGGMLWERSMHASVQTVENDNPVQDVSKTDDSGSTEGDETDGQQTKKRKGPGFRDRKVIEYENRIRSYSTPDKIFRYFATLKVMMDNGDWDIFMTPQDFVRSITPNEKQPDGFGLDQFKKIDPHKYKGSSKHTWDEDSIFSILGACGLISFSDYMFLLTVLSTPERHFEIAFRLFDLNGDGEVQSDEFQQVTDIIRAQTATGKRHRDRKTTGNVINKASNSSLMIYFFGEDSSKKLTIKDFLSFHRKLRRDLLKLEFNKYEPVDGKITERNLAKFLTVHGNLTQQKRSRMMKRVKKKFADDPQGITFDEMEAVQVFLCNVNDIDTALSFYHVAGADIDPITMKHVAKMVGGADLSERVVDVIYALFDENDDGKLSHKEFITAMKNRRQRGLDKPKELGFSRIFEAMWKCAKKTKINFKE